MKLKKVVPLLLSVVFLVLMLAISASATGSVTVQKTGTAFDRSFQYDTSIYQAGSDFPLGTMRYSFTKRSVLYDLDKSICICEHDYVHYSVLVEGIGSSNYGMYTSSYLQTHGNATIEKRHYGPTVTYGATINCN